MNRFAKVIGYIALFFLIVLGTGLWAVQAKWFWTDFLPGVVNAKLKDVQITSVEVADVYWRFPGQAIFKDLRLAVERKKEQYVADCRYVHFDSTSPGWEWPKELKLHAESCDFYGRPFNIQDMDISLAAEWSRTGVHKAAGRVSFQELKSGDYALTDTSADINMLGRDIIFDDLDGHVAEGRLTGTITLENSEKFPHRVSVHLQKINVPKLSRTGKGIFQGVQGQVDGQIEMTGDVQGIHSLDSNLNMVEGGQLRAVWLKFLLDRLPANSSQYKDLAELVKNDGAVFFEKFSVSTKSLSPEKIITAINLESRRFNLNLNNQVDINLEGGFSELWRFLDHFSN